MFFDKHPIIRVWLDKELYRLPELGLIKPISEETVISTCKFPSLSSLILFSLFNVSLTSSSAPFSIYSIAIFLKVKLMVNSIFLKNLQFKFWQFGKSINDSSCAIVLGTIPDTLVPSTNFKVSLYQLYFLQKPCSPCNVFPLNLDGTTGVTVIVLQLEHELSILLTMPRPVSFPLFCNLCI